MCRLQYCVHCAAPPAPSAYPTTLESALDVTTKQPTSQMSESDVTTNKSTTYTSAN